jgi:hypothetical protein
MKYSEALLVVALAASVAVAADEPAPTNPPPDAATLMETVAGQLPREALTITGEIEVTRRHGSAVRELGFEMRLDFGAETPAARYTIREASGKDLARLTITRRGARAQKAYEVGDPLQSADAPDMAAPVFGTDMTWQDLTLSFLWWRKGAVLGDDVVKGRACNVVELQAPAGEPAGKVKLWIDKQIPMMLQAEAFDAKGRKVRSLWIKSFKKIKGRWMVREMEVQQEPPAHRTHVTITGLDGRTLEGDDGGDAVSPQPVGDAGAATNTP